MITIADLPAVNATLNATAAILLVCGYLMIRQRRIETHRRFMLAAFATSALFLVSYLIYHANVGSRPFPGQGAIRTVYSRSSSRTSCSPPPSCPWRSSR